jgi:hypothetical protein
MSSTARTEANRLNAQASTGPKTAEGKQRASLNSVKHGFTGQTMILPAEEADAYRAFTESFLRELSPEGVNETHLAHLIMTNRWRLTQMATMEAAIYALGVRENAAQFADETPEVALAMSRVLTFEQKRKELDRLRRYENSISRQVNHDTKLLAELQTARKAKEAEQEKDAIALHTYFTTANQPWNPAHYGLDLSIEQIQRLHHKTRCASGLSPRTSI